MPGWLKTILRKSCHWKATTCRTRHDYHSAVIAISHISNCFDLVYYLTHLDM